MQSEDWGSFFKALSEKNLYSYMSYMDKLDPPEQRQMLLLNLCRLKGNKKIRNAYTLYSYLRTNLDALPIKVLLLYLFKEANIGTS